MRANIVIMLLFTFAIGQFAAEQSWSTVAIVGVIVMVILWKTFDQINRLERGATPDEPPPETLPAATGEAPGQPEARRATHTNGGYRQAQKP